MVKKTLYGGPHDGEQIEIHKDHIKLKARIEICGDGKVSVYGVDDDGRFVWLPDPEDPRVSRGFFVCDDDGRVISEESSTSDALEKLDELNDDGESWKF